MKTTFAQKLIEAGAVRLSPAKPFTWASGWHSPIYCDNRRLLSFPDVRSFVKDGLVALVRQHFADAEVIAGVATGAIAMGALVADVLEKPFVYVRPKPKDHGMGNQIEGRLPENASVVVVEDLISTGMSSLKAVDALRAAGANIKGMVASFTYDFPIAKEAFESAQVELYTLSDYPHVLAYALQNGDITSEQQAILSQWRDNPAEWGKE
ncbi:MAG: orotate phosphoribosyltransferase [Bacteroidaceae bacterium]|nr:orotate phosphoribosyltransferase [Bacteroidaceae bacterium]